MNRNNQVWFMIGLVLVLTNTYLFKQLFFALPSYQIIFFWICSITPGIILMKGAYFTSKENHGK